MTLPPPVNLDFVVDRKTFPQYTPPIDVELKDETNEDTTIKVDYVKPGG